MRTRRASRPGNTAALSHHGLRDLGIFSWSSARARSFSTVGPAVDVFLFVCDWAFASCTLVLFAPVGVFVFIAW